MQHIPIPHYNVQTKYDRFNGWKTRSSVALTKYVLRWIKYLHTHKKEDFGPFDHKWIEWGLGAHSLSLLGPGEHQDLWRHTVAIAHTATTCSQAYRNHQPLADMMNHSQTTTPKFILFVLVLFYAISNSISVIPWRWYDVWDNEEKAWVHTFTDSMDL